MPYIGTLEYHIVSDGLAWVDGGGAFGLVPQVIWKLHRSPNENNSIPFSLNSLLIRSEGKVILVDTGYGRKLSPKMQSNTGLERAEGDLLDALERIGVKAKEVDIVINTHLHADHCGGNTIRHNDRLAPTFPNAQYLIQRLEWADAVMPNERTRATYFPENYQPLLESGHAKIISGDTTVTGQVRTAIARGHTRAHQVVILESEGETALFVADMATLHYHFERLAWVPSYDVEPLESIETKRYWQQWAVAREALILFQHDTEILAGRLRPEGRRFKIEPVSIT